MAARRFENVAFPGETRQVAIHTKAAAAPPPVHSAHQDRRRDAAVLCQLVGCRKAEWVAGDNAGFGRWLSGSGGFRAPRHPCSAGPAETLLHFSVFRRDLASNAFSPEAGCWWREET